MKRDFEHMYDLDSMADAEIEALITEQFHEIPEIDPDLVDIVVDAGFVELHGRVGTEQELQRIEHVVTDILGVSRYRNNIVIDRLTRAELSEAADEAVIQDAIEQGESYIPPDRPIQEGTNSRENH